MHRASGSSIPIAPITHHLQDATHIAYGVVTLGLISENRVKLEASLFNGREPDQNRWGFETPRINSYAVRVTVNPSRELSIQGSIAELDEPEQLHPGIDVVKLSASVTYNRRFAGGNVQVTGVFGRNKNERTLIPIGEARATFPPSVLAHYLALGDSGGMPSESAVLLFPGRVQHGFLLETSAQVHSWTLFARLERAQKDELFPPSDLRHSQVFGVEKITGALARDLPRLAFGTVGVGISVSAHFVPEGLQGAYGRSPKSYHVFTRFRLHD